MKLPQQSRTLHRLKLKVRDAVLNSLQFDLKGLTNIADAKTYLNSAYYTDIYDALLQDWIDAGKTEADMLDPDSGEPVAQDIKQIEEDCPGRLHGYRR